MTPRTSERERLQKKVADDSDPPPWRDVISLEVALRGEDGDLPAEIRELAEAPPDVLDLVHSISERWAEDWDVPDSRLSSAIERDAFVHNTTPLRSKSFAMQEGLRRALLEAEDRGITKVIERGGADSTSWFNDIRKHDLEKATIALQGPPGECVGTAARDAESTPPVGRRNFTGFFGDLEEIATGGDPEHLALPATSLRAFLFACWVRARTTQFAERYLLATLYRYPDDFFDTTTT